MVRNKLKKIFMKLALKYLLPGFLVIIICVAIVALLFEVPRMIADNIAAFFGSSFNTTAQLPSDLIELKTFFESNPDFEGLEEIQSPEVLAKYVELQMHSGIMNYQPYSVTDYYVNGVYEYSTNQAAVNDFFDASVKYTTPWQLMSAVDIVNENYGVTDLSSEVISFNEQLRPLFNGRPSSDFDATVFETKTVTSHYVITTIQKVDAITRMPLETPIESVHEYTETKVIKTPKPIFESIEYYDGKITNEIEYITRVMDPVSSTRQWHNTSYEEKYHTVTTSYEVLTPTIKNSYYSASTSRMNGAIQTSIPYDSVDILVDLVSMYPNGYELAANINFASIGNLTDFATGTYTDTVYDFVYPTLKNTTTGRHFRSDLVDLGLSVKGLDYFWGGKFRGIGFNAGWGKLTPMTAGGHPASGMATRYGLDCSGFAQWVYVNAGLELAASTRDMLNLRQVREIPLSEIQLGDLAFYHNYSNGESYNHVGIYVGMENGRHMFVHSGGYGWADADHPLGQVTVSALNENVNGNAMVKFKKFYRYTGKTLY